MLALGIGKGDEVITVPNTFIASTNPILYCGGTIKFVDVKPDTALIDIDLLEKSITTRTKALLIVDLFGQMPDMKRIRELADDYSLSIVEDACQAHGAMWDGHMPGFYSDIACYSFYPSKNLGCHGDAGAVTTNNKDIADRIRILGNQGRTSKYLHTKIGYNYRLDTVQARILNDKLFSLSEWINKRRSIAKNYDSFLSDYIVEDDLAKHVYHLYVIKVEDRFKLMDFLKGKGIGFGIHYPVPLHLQPCYNHLKLRGFIVSEYLAERILSIPMYPELSSVQQDYVIDNVLKGVMK
jgi:dTDP-4-amino-4,6-dideoxygalactose transaminase